MLSNPVWFINSHTILACCQLMYCWSDYGNTLKNNNQSQIITIRSWGQTPFEPLPPTFDLWPWSPQAVVYERPGFEGSCLEIDGDVFGFGDEGDEEASNLESNRLKSVGSVKILRGL